MTVIVTGLLEAGSLTRRLREYTHASHDRLDRFIMAADPFASSERYGLFLQMQHGFHRDIAALYDSPTLIALLPDLPRRRRLGLIEEDLADLAIAPLPSSAAPPFAPDAAVDLPAALGWLYVAEGSNLGAAFLIKEAAKLGFSDSFGARHLAGAPEGRALHWKTFTAALDAVELDEADRERALAGAEAAFGRVRGLADQLLS